MIARVKWFKPRKYGGWGAAPATWQGWVYLIGVLLPFILFQLFFSGSDIIRIIVTILWLLFLFVDVFSVMIRLSKEDEMDEKMELFSERNAAWVMMIVLVMGILYESMYSVMAGSFEVDAFLMVALFGGVVAKSISNYVLIRRGV